MAIGTYISTITLTVNGLNAPTKRHRLAEWIQKQDPYICCLKETHCRPHSTYRLKVREWKNIYNAKGKQKKVGSFQSSTVIELLSMSPFMSVSICLVYWGAPLLGA